MTIFTNKSVLLWFSPKFFSFKGIIENLMTSVKGGTLVLMATIIFFFFFSQIKTWIPNADLIVSSSVALSSLNIFFCCYGLYMKYILKKLLYFILKY